MTNYYLAIDIGASGGRHILGHIEDGKLITEEIYRFKNAMKSYGNELVWVTEALFENILEGMKKCREIGKIPAAVGIDTWGVDFVLLDENDRRVGHALAYRDSRTDGMEDLVEKIISFEELYEHTGIQKQKFNTLYQLMSLKIHHREQLERAELMMMLPDYFGYRLTGVKAQEYTNATTSGLVNANTKYWDFDMIDRLGLPRKIFGDIKIPGTLLGNIQDSIRREIGYDTRVYMTASHDTASAIMSVPALNTNSLYISSGTWSLMGTEILKPICSRRALKCNLTNEGGYDYRYRFLKNIMGLWMIQSVRGELEPDMSYEYISRKASVETLNSLVDVNDGRFLAPKSMAGEIVSYCQETGQPVPRTIAEFGRVIYRSLAKCYAGTLKEIESITGVRYESLNIVGGGSKSEYLSQETANMTGRTVFCGPEEGTALGNLLVLLIAEKEIPSLEAGRRLIYESTDMKRYDPI